MSLVYTLPPAGNANRWAANKQGWKLLALIMNIILDLVHLLESIFTIVAVILDRKQKA